MSLARRRLFVEQAERFGGLAAENFLGETGHRLLARETEDVQHVALAIVSPQNATS